MNGYGKRIGALFLTVCLLLSLAACGDKEKGDADEEKLSGPTYAAEFKAVQTGDRQFDGINSDDVTAVGENFYFIAHFRTPIEGKQDQFTFGQGVFRLDAGTGEVKAIEGFDFDTDGEDPDVQTYMGGIRPGADGTVWIGVTTSKTLFELPEGFDEEKDDRWNYYAGSEEHTVWHRIDDAGNEISSVEIKPVEPSADGETVGYFDSRAMVFDNDGCYYTKDDSFIYVTDPAKDTTIKIDAKDMWGQLFLLGDGTVGIFDRGHGIDDGIKVLVVDKAEQKLGKSYPIDGISRGEIFSGGGKYLFAYTRGDALYGYIDEKTPAERLFSWTSVDVNRSSVQAVSFLEEGRVSAFTYEYSFTENSNDKAQLVMMKPVDPSTLPQKTHLTLACQYMSSALRRSIIDFNRKNDTVRIDIRDYSEYNTKDNYDVGMTKLNAEIVAGNVPDLMMEDGLPLAQYVSKGLIEDLWPFIDGDPDLGRDKLMIRPLEAAQIDGILPQIFDNFSIDTVIGPTKIVGDKPGWTVEDLNAAMAKMPEGARIFSDTTTKANMLDMFLAQSMGNLVDWNTGECRFDSPEFIDILNFCDRFAAEFDSDKVNWQEREDDTSVIQRGMQLLMVTNVSALQDMQLHRAIFGGDFTYIGFPTDDGRSGSTFNVNNGIAMSSKCKDKEAAWQFLRMMLLEGSDEDMDRLWDAPVNKAMFDKYMELQMKKRYQTDENGNNVLDKNGEPIEESQGGWGMGDIMVKIYASTQEDLDQFMELYNATSTMVGWDMEINDIVTKEAEPFFKGDKSAEETAKQIQSRMKLYINEQR